MSARKVPSARNIRPASKNVGAKVNSNSDGTGKGGAAFSEARIAARVADLGKEISRDYQGRRLDIVITLDRGFVFGADLIRKVSGPVVCHFVHEDVRDIEEKGRPRREVFFGARPYLKGRDVLLVDAVLESGVPQDFLLRRLGESSPRSLRLAVLLDKPGKRRVRTASKEVWVGYGLAAANGTGRNLRQLSSGAKSVGKSERRKK
jgi:hypoxanthine phosphoribosyltransferase